jgi:hypothetical protein
VLAVATLAAAALAAAAVPASAPLRPAADGLHARTAGAVAPDTSARGTVAWNGGRVTASTGEQLTVFVSTAYAPDQHSPQGWADFIAALPHGPELGLLTAYVAPLDELAEICGPHALGCYGGGELFSSGDVYETVTPQEIVRHEYGHHIAANRLNPPWRAIDWGPKAWATEEGVCSRVADHTAFPGDEGDLYELNPGEGWAEAYRVFADQRTGATPGLWEIVDPSFEPDAEALAAIERDVLQPWAAPTTATYAKRFVAKTPKGWSIPIATPYDGDIAVTVTLPRGGYHTVALLSGKTVLARGLWAGARVQRITTTVCGARALTLRITRRGSLGRVAVTVTTP